MIYDRKTYEEWAKWENNEKQAELITYEHYIAEKFYKILERIDNDRTREDNQD